MVKDIKSLSVGESIIIDLEIKEAKEQVFNMKLNKRFKFIEAEEGKTTIVRVSGSKTIYSCINDVIESGGIYAGCFMDGNSQSIKNAVCLMNKMYGYSISCKEVGGKSYLHEDLSLKESISLDDFKIISKAFEVKLEELENKISIED
jgi:hypothetical protein